MSNRCPVCDRADLAEDLSRCVQCGADLECFRLLDSLPEHPPEQEGAGGAELSTIGARLDALQDRMDQSVRTGRRTAFAAVAALLLLAVLITGLAGALFHALPELGSARREVSSTSPIPPAVHSDLQPIQRTLYGVDAIESRLEQRLAEVQERLGAELSTIDQRLEAIEVRLSSLASLTVQRPLEQAIAPTEPAEAKVDAADEQAAILWHRPRPNDSLWKIARKYLGQGHLYPLLLELNPGLGVVFSPTHGPIRVPADPRQARARMAQLTVERGHRLLFLARVLPREDWENLAKRFFGSTHKAARLRQLNGGVLAPEGERVLVPLYE